MGLRNADSFVGTKRLFIFQGLLKVYDRERPQEKQAEGMNMKKNGQQAKVKCRAIEAEVS